MTAPSPPEEREALVAKRPYYDKALAALETAHKACFEHGDRGVLGMSHGPFSGVNEALGVVTTMEATIADLNAIITKQTAERDALQARVAELEASTVARGGAEEIQVKPLRWKKSWNGKDWSAHSTAGRYDVGIVGTGNSAILRLIQADGQTEDIIIASGLYFRSAKAAAQADYDARIRSALVPPAIRALPINDEEGT
jgi:hypothetical protein